MKSKMRFILVGIVAIVAVIGYCKVRPSESLNTLLLDNVEALASDETEGIIYCIGVGSVDCPLNNVKVRRVYGSYSLRH